MCGIAGIIALKNADGREAAESVIQKMNEVQFHRGPDGEGIYLSQSGSVAFGHRRLSIIDLSEGGHQPMENAKGVITFNGEIYNYRELREELKEKGFVFQSNSDTEVLLSALSLWGKDTFSRLNGMWAFAWYNSEEEKVLLCRDRFGIKPLYYWVNQDKIYFASEIKAFTVIPEWKADLNYQNAMDFLTYGVFDHNEHTLFKDIRQVRPGSYLEIDLKNQKLHKVYFWN